MQQYLWPAAVIVSIFGVITYIMVRNAKRKIEQKQKQMSEEK